jgi:aqualysin 1
MKKVYALLLAAFVVCAPLLNIPQAQGQGQSQEIQGKFRRTRDPILNQYIVRFSDDFDRFQVASTANHLASIHGGTIKYIYEHTIKGFAVQLPEPAAIALSHSPLVEYVEEDAKVTASTIQSQATWGLDRIDSRARIFDGLYTYDDGGQGVYVYVIDTGIRTSHQEFGGRASIAYDAFGGNGQDCNGHGTHVAGTIGGATYGVAKGVTLFGVRVLDCGGSGTASSVIAGLDFVTNRKNNVHPSTPTVANMSLGGGADTSIDDAVRRAIQAGVTCVIAAGNSNVNASNQSPARVTEAITVGAIGSSSDCRWVWNSTQGSNYGSVVDLFAPGENITSAWIDSDSATNTITGTSMATPHVAGVAALFLGNNQTASPATIASLLTTHATSGVVCNAGTGSPNRLLFSRSNTSTFVSQSVPTQMVRGQSYNVSITMRNSGFTSWSCGSDYCSFKLGTQNPQDNTLWTGVTRIYLPPNVTVTPGSQYTFNFTVTAPSTPGSYNFQWQMINELAEWFGAFTPNVVVTVN